MPKKDIFFGIIFAVLLVIILSPFASRHPGGLERIAQDKGFLEKEKAQLPAVMSGYSFPGIKNERLSVVIAGILGIAMVFSAAYLLSILMRKSKKH